MSLMKKSGWQEKNHIKNPAERPKESFTEPWQKQTQCIVISTPQSFSQYSKMTKKKRDSRHEMRWLPTPLSVFALWLVQRVASSVGCWGNQYLLGDESMGLVLKSTTSTSCKGLIPGWRKLSYQLSDCTIPLYMTQLHTTLIQGSPRKVWGWYQEYFSFGHPTPRQHHHLQQHSDHQDLHEWGTRCIWWHVWGTERMIPPVAGGIQETPPAQSVSATSELGAQLMAQPQERCELLPSCLLIFSWNGCIPALLNHAPRLPLPTRTHRHVSGSFKISPSPETILCCAAAVRGRCI